MTRASRTSKRHQPNFTKNILHDQVVARQQIAFSLLLAVHDLYPDQFREFRGIGEQLFAENDDELAMVDHENRLARERFRTRVAEWTSANRISSETVNEVARAYLLGQLPSSGGFIEGGFDQAGNFIDSTPALTASPFEETREEFLRRAAAYYDDLAGQYAKEPGVTRGPIKRDRNHVLFLVANRVGNWSWADIEFGRTGLNLPTQSEQAIGNGARAVAKLLGIPMPTIRGNRKGAARHKRPSRRWRR